MFRRYGIRPLIAVVVDGGWTLLFLSLMCMHSVKPVSGQNPTPTPCPSVAATSPGDAWEQNAKLTVDIDSRYSPAQIECIKKGIASWQRDNSSTGSASGVVINTYTYGQASAAHNTLIIQIAAGPPGTDIAHTDQTTGTNGRLDWAITQVNPGVTSCDALTEMAAHEFGHTLGLSGHCTPTTGCANKSNSIMTTAADGAYDAAGNLVNPNAIKGTAGNPLLPTNCDNQKVKDAGQYDPSKTNPPQPNPPATGGGGGTTPRPRDYYHHAPVCYLAVEITNWYQCYGSGGCNYVGSSYRSLGINCY
jgi:hypothetical protein